MAGAELRGRELASEEIEAMFLEFRRTGDRGLRKPIRGFRGDDRLVGLKRLIDEMRQRVVVVLQPPLTRDRSLRIRLRALPGRAFLEARRDLDRRPVVIRADCTGRDAQRDRQHAKAMQCAPGEHAQCGPAASATDGQCIHGQDVFFRSWRRR